MIRFISIITILLIVGFDNLNCQTTRYLITYYPNSKLVKDSTSVLIDKPQIKHGRFISYYNKPVNSSYSSNTNTWIKTEGFYFNNLKDSVWRDYKDPLKAGYRLIKEEHYSKGKKIGIWKKQIDKFVYERFDYDKNKKLFPFFESVVPIYPNEAIDKEIECKVQLRVTYNDDYSIRTIESLLPADSMFIRPMIEIAKNKSEMLKKYATEFKDTIIREEIFKVDYRLK